MNEKSLNSQTEVEQPLPRYELRYDQVARFVPVIKQAIVLGKLIVDLSNQEKVKEQFGGKGRGMNARTFVCRCSDAILGLIRYKYEFAELDDVRQIGFDFRNLELTELEGQKVRIVNKVSAFQEKVQKSTRPHARNLAEVEKMIKEFVYTGNALLIDFDTEEQKQQVLALQKVNKNVVVHYNEHDHAIKVM